MSILIVLAILAVLYVILYFIAGNFAMGVYPYLAVITLLITSFVKLKNERKFLLLWLIISVVLCFGKRFLTKPDDGYQWVKTNCSNCGKNCICDVAYWVDEVHWRQSTPQGSPFYICSEKCNNEYLNKREKTYGMHTLYPKINGKYDSYKHSR